MNKPQRIEIIKDAARLLEEIGLNDANLVLHEYGLPPYMCEFRETFPEFCRSVLSDLEDDALVELYRYLGGESVVTAVRGSPPVWPEARLRLFMSHTWPYRAVVGRVKAALTSYGIASFIAHEDIEPSKEWLDVIEGALNTCDALVAFLTDDFHQSLWTDQEVGFCLGRGVSIVPVMLENTTPYGLMGRYQGARCQRLDERGIAEKIFGAIARRPQLRTRLEEGLIDAFVRSTSFAQANSRSDRMVEHVKNWTPERLQRIQQAGVSNSQISRAHDGRRTVEYILREHAHIWPPPTPAKSGAPILHSG